MIFRQILKGFAILVLINFAGCTPAVYPDRKIVTMAVWDLENTNEPPVAAEMGELLAAKIIETLEDLENYQVVERERLILALEELNLGSSFVVNKSTRLKIGRLVGARLMVFG